MINFFKKFNIPEIFKKTSGEAEKKPISEETSGESAPISEETSGESASIPEKDKESKDEELKVKESKGKESIGLQRLQEKLFVSESFKEFEKRMDVLCLSEEQRSEIFQQIKVKSDRISEKIISEEIENIKEKYGFEATPAEVYGARIKILQTEIKKIKEKLNYRYRQLLNLIKEGRYGPNSDRYLLFYKNINLLKADFGHLPEVQEFCGKIESNNGETYSDDLAEFKEVLRKKTEEGSVYKTPEEVKEAESELDRLQQIAYKNNYQLIKIKKREGELRLQSLRKRKGTSPEKE